MLEPLYRCCRDSTLFQFTTKRLRDFIDPDHLLIQIDERLDFAKLAAHCEGLELPARIGLSMVTEPQTGRFCCCQLPAAKQEGQPQRGTAPVYPDVADLRCFASEQVQLDHPRVPEFSVAIVSFV